MKDCPNENQKLNEDNDFLDQKVKEICDTYEDVQGINHIEGFNLPSESLSLRSIKYNVGEILSTVYAELSDQIMRAFRYDCAMDHCEDCDIPVLTETATKTLIGRLPEIRNTMKLDVAAAFDGDPAAKSLDEIILSYPGIKAITIQRIAHVLYHQNVPLIPRMLCEYAHRVTGIDIHPGAHLGKAMFIDHGTGVVIGETSKIGDNVKIYQGVTLGALSFPKNACGEIIKGAKRHPTIEGNVTIYAGATILGNVVIGKDSIIGGNVWLTESVDPGTKVTIPNPQLTIKKKK